MRRLRARDPLTNPLYVAGFWTFYTLLSLNQSFVWALVANRDRAWYEPLPWALSTAVVWALLTPAIVHLSRARRLERARWTRNIGWHVIGCVVAGLADAGGDQIARAATDMPYSFWPDFFRQLDVVAFYYGMIAGVAHAADYYRLFRDRELRTANLEAELRESQLQLLKSQLQPHFLFNTLNAVNALIYEDPKAADRTLTRLGDLLRMTLAVGSAQVIPLAFELEFIRAYLEIQQTRLGDRLSWSIDAPEMLNDAAVPTLLLQPLVENAVLHGIAPLVRGGAITVEVARDTDMLHITIADTGAGVAANVRERIGLSNVRQRLQQLYGREHTLTISQNALSGTRVTIAIPYHAAANTAELKLNDDVALTA
jgi:two-component system, LytTR family, sensor kinase